MLSAFVVTKYHGSNNCYSNAKYLHTIESVVQIFLYSCIFFSKIIRLFTRNIFTLGALISPVLFCRIFSDMAIYLCLIQFANS